MTLGTSNGLDKNYYLGSLNPRSFISDQEHGIFNASFPNALKFGNPNWTFSCSTDGSSPDLAGMGSWGDDSVSADPPIYFHIPRRAPVSIGEYRHANLGFYAHEPAYVIGSSEAPISTLLGNTDITKPVDDWRSGAGHLSAAYSKANLSFGTLSDNWNTHLGAELSSVNVFLDLSYLYNKELWDSYYLSTLSYDSIPDTINGKALPNYRHHLITKHSDQQANLSEYDRSASELMIDGAFNINSTSVKAWEAQLLSMKDIHPLNASGSFNHVFLRTPTSSKGNGEWDGFNELDSNKITTLAEEIVKEIKTRGPFLSLSHFINRGLVNRDSGRKGALAQAIENSQINGSKHPNALGSLNQGDLVTALGPTLTARSDTFTIRTKGEAIDPTTGKIIGSAWLQAIVQRVPEYLKNDDPVYTNPKELTNASNQSFGRRYKVISFKWLNEEEL